MRKNNIKAFFKAESFKLNLHNRLNSEAVVSTDEVRRNFLFFRGLILLITDVRLPRLLSRPCSDSAGVSFLHCSVLYRKFHHDFIELHRIIVIMIKLSKSSLYFKTF